MASRYIKEQQKVQVDLVLLWRVLQANLIKIGVVALLLGAALGLYRYTNAVPTYTTETKFLVNGVGNPCVAGSNELMCNGCSTCANVCPYGAITYENKEFRMPDRTTKVRRVAAVNPAVCQGCGCCTVACPSGAMDLKGFANLQIMAEVDAICK